MKAKSKNSTTGLTKRARSEPDKLADELTRGLIACKWDLKKLASAYCVSRDTLRRTAFKLGLGEQIQMFGQLGRAQSAREEWERWRRGLSLEHQHLADQRVLESVKRGHSASMGRIRSKQFVEHKIRKETEMRFFAVFEDGSRVELLSRNLNDATAEAEALGAVGVARASE